MGLLFATNQKHLLLFPVFLHYNEYNEIYQHLFPFYITEANLVHGSTTNPATLMEFFFTRERLTAQLSETAQKVSLSCFAVMPIIGYGSCAVLIGFYHLERPMANDGKHRRNDINKETE